jgi:ribonuclease HI
MKKNKWYVVWNGRKPGIYNNWDQCDESVHGFSDCHYKTFPDFEDALAAFYMGYAAYAEQRKRNRGARPGKLNRTCS